VAPLWVAIAVGIATSALIALNIWASVVAVRADSAPGAGKLGMQIAGIWLLPVLGAFTVLELHRRERPPADYPLAAHEVNQDVQAFGAGGSTGPNDTPRS
jgi:hypothetical protein